MTLNDFSDLLSEEIRKTRKYTATRELQFELDEDDQIRVYFTELDVDAAMGGFLSYCTEHHFKEGAQ